MEEITNNNKGYYCEVCKYPLLLVTAIWMINLISKTES